jgi:hypothetical protein
MLSRGRGVVMQMLKQAIRFAGDDDLRALLEQWARDRPGQVVEHGPV